MPGEYRESLAKLASPFSHLVEVGVHRGRTSQFLLERLPHITLTLVDPWMTYSEATAEQQATFRAETLERINRYSARWTLLEMPSVEAARYVESADIVFIDADHSYEACLADCRAWWPVVEYGGVLCGHDFGKGLGVDQAVMEWAAETGTTVTTHPGHIWAVHK